MYVNSQGEIHPCMLVAMLRGSLKVLLILNFDPDPSTPRVSKGLLLLSVNVFLHVFVCLTFFILFLS